MKNTISQHIKHNIEELDSKDLSGQRRRHLQNELNSLEKYHKNHPNDDYDPTPLELYCDENPDALGCRVYED
jgi:hypothetical protein